MEEDISRYIGFCVITLKTAIPIADDIVSHYANACIFQDILERKIAMVEKESGAIFNANTIITLIRESVWLCVKKFGKDFLFKEECWLDKFQNYSNQC